MENRRKYFLIVVGVSLAGALTAPGCSLAPVSTSQVSSITESRSEGNCRAKVSVKETRNGRTVVFEQSDVPCSAAKALKEQMIAKAKRQLCE